MKVLICLIALAFVFNAFAQVPCDLHGCTFENAVETVSDDVTITFSSQDYAYSPKCLRVKSGAKVTFSGQFNGHPLVSGFYNESAGQTTPVDGSIENTSSGTSATFTMDSTGSNPYYCRYHTGAGMYGVVYVGDSCAAVQPTAPQSPVAPISSPVASPTGSPVVAPTSRNPTAATPVKASSAATIQFMALILIAVSMVLVL